VAKNDLKQKNQAETWFFLFLSGAAGIRTPVQTSSKSAFYMLILSLIVGRRPVKGEPIGVVFSLIFVLPPRLQQAYSGFFDASDGTLSDRASREAIRCLILD